MHHMMHNSHSHSYIRYVRPATLLQKSCGRKCIGLRPALASYRSHVIESVVIQGVSLYPDAFLPSYKH